MAFADDMRNVAKNLCQQLGNPAILTKITRGQYNPTTGKTDEVRQDFNVYTAQNSKFNEAFGRDGQNTNLSNFQTESVVVPWLGELIDATWEYNNSSIVNVTEVMSQNKVIIQNLTIGIKN